ncbi:MAG: hypothetical protein HY996_01985 [Micrococcales bacterium]|nr:hypothetical protein [Micrococcales bacterium]
MTRSNRTLNRMLLALVGVFFLGLAAVLAWPWAAESLPVLPPAPRLALDSVALWVTSGVALAIVVLALTWILSRGRGGTRTALTVGDVSVATAAVEHTVRDELADVPSVLAVAAGAHRLRGRTALEVTISTRRSADLPALLERVRSAVRALDTALGAEVPLVVRITTGWRSGLAHVQRAE